LSEKRRDQKGRILKDGESQRSSGLYMYRYTDVRKKRRYVYAKTLEDLRQREAEIQRDLSDGIDYTAGEITVIELVERYINLKRGLKENSIRAYGTVINRIKEDPFGAKQIKQVKLSDAKGWFVSLHDRGFRQNTIGVMQSVVRPAFEMAVDDDIIRKNPFKFKLSDVIPNDAYVRTALNKEQQEQYLRFVQEYGDGNYYDDIVILLGTGMRVSELYGLTKADIDLERRCIHVRKQLCRTANKPYFITSPKTKSGIRTIPMTDEVYFSFKRVLKARAAPKVEMLVDGCTGFLFLDKAGMPKVAMHLENYMRCLQEKHPWALGSLFPKVTPHVLRHTFCTNMQQAGIDIKSLQYLMGHSNASVTLDVYTHTDYNAVKRAFDLAAGNL
jgi:site-specific recombinase XerD